MPQQTLQDLSTPQLTQLDSELKLGKVSPDSQKILQSLDDNTLHQLNNAYFKANTASTGSPTPAPVSNPQPLVSNAPQASNLANSLMNQGKPQPTQQQAPEPTLMKVVDVVNAAGGGMAKGALNVASATGGFITDMANKLGVISDKTESSINAKGEQVRSALDPTGNTVAGEAMAQHLYVAKASEIATEIAGYTAGTGLAAGKMASLVPEIAQGSLSETGANILANGLLGSVAAGKDNRLQGTIIGGVAAGAVDAVVKGTKAVIAAPLVKAKLTDVVSKVNSMIDNIPTAQAAAQSISNMWNAVKSVTDKAYAPIHDSTVPVEAKGISASANNILSKSADVLAPAQKGAIKSVAALADNVNNLDSLLTVKRQLANSSSLFFKSNTSPDVLQSISALKTQVQDQLEQSAKQAGLLKELTWADKWFSTRELPMRQAGADDIASSLKASKEIPLGANPAVQASTPTEQFALNSQPTVAAAPDNLIDKAINVNKGSPAKLKSLTSQMDANGNRIIAAHITNRAMQAANVGSDGFDALKTVKYLTDTQKTWEPALNQEGQDLINGVKKVALEASALSKNASTGEKTVWIKPLLTSQAPALALGGLGYAHGGTKEAIQGVMIGEAAAGLKSGLNSMLMSQTGQKVLIEIGKHPQAVKQVTQTLKTMLNLGVNNFVKNEEE